MQIKKDTQDQNEGGQVELRSSDEKKEGGDFDDVSGGQFPKKSGAESSGGSKMKYVFIGVGFFGLVLLIIIIVVVAASDGPKRTRCPPYFYRDED